jgi:hypothetical protein
VEHLTEELIRRIVARKFESLRVDYKRSLDLSESKHKVELVKDVSAQANTLDVDETLVELGLDGTVSYIVIGADEQGNLYDIRRLHIDDAMLQQIVNEKVEPRIKFHFRPFYLTDATGRTTEIGGVIVPRSSNPPHRLTKHYGGQLRKGQCFLREGTSTRQANDRDLERMYDYRLSRSPHRSEPKMLDRSGIEVVGVDVVDKPRQIAAFRRMWFGETETTNEGKFPLIDIKLLNTSKSTAFLKALRFDVEYVRSIPETRDFQAMPVTWEYSVLLNPHRNRDSKVIEISQVIPPNSVERFVVVVGQCEDDQRSFRSVTYDVTLTLQYNANDSIRLGRRLITVYPPVFFLPEEPSEIKSLAAG